MRMSILNGTATRTFEPTKQTGQALGVDLDLDIGGLETFRVSKSTRETLQPFRACRELAQGTG